MTTFSQIIDDLRVEMTRPDLTESMRAYANQTVRQLHFSPGAREMPLLLGSNRVEDQIDVESSPHLWTVPSVARFQLLEAAWAPARNTYLVERDPTVSRDRGINNFASRDYWYRTGSQIAFSGVVVGEKLDLSYFEYPRSLRYYLPANRPVIWNYENEEFEFHQDYDIDDDTRAIALSLCTHWVLQRWEEAVKQGVRAKVYSRLGEESRAKIAYSAFETERNEFQGAESYKHEQR